ncbi:MAG: hypothetical protein RL653_324 [Pseudomonadota bacterium]|jgi:uncharacterized protein
MSNLRLLCLAVSALGSFQAAHAAGIQCKKARAPAEKLICSSRELLAADDALARMYKETLDAAESPDEVVTSQKAWLKSRDACRDAACVASAYRSRDEALQQFKRAEWITYSDPALGISFEHLSNRQVKKPCPSIGGEQCVALVARGMKKDEYLVAFEITSGTLEDVAADKAGFEKQDNGRWMTTAGRFEAQPVEHFHGTGWKGMRATVTCGISDPQTGFHAAAGECFWAVMGNGKRAAVVNTQGLVGTDAATMRSVSTFRFSR